MNDAFSEAAPNSAPLLPGERELQRLNIPYERQDDNTLLVKGNIDISYQRRSKLPDLSNVIVLGNFYCEHNNLISLEGSPRWVGGYFYCHYNKLVTLEYAPLHVGKNFACERNNLISLKGAPSSVDGYFRCDENRLPHLEDAPREFRELISDFGRYSAWERVPEKYRISPETRERLVKEAEAAAAAREELIRRASSPAVPKGGMVLNPLPLNLPPKKLSP